MAAAVEEVDLHTDLKDLQRLTDAEQHLISGLVGFFATGDTIVATTWCSTSTSTSTRRRAAST